MDLLQLEIFIPKESEVKKVSVRALPKSVIRRLSLSLPAATNSKAPTDLPECIWISPAVIRRRDQKHPAPSEPVTSLLYREFQVSQGPLQMSIMSPNRVAYRVLQDIMPGTKPSTHSAVLPYGSPRKTDQDTIIVYHGRIYLITRNPKRRRSQQETPEPQLTSPSSIQSSSAVSADDQQKASLEPADQQKKRLCVTLPRASLNPDIITKTENMSVTDKASLETADQQKKRLCVTLPPASLKPDVITTTENVSVTDKDLINNNNQLISAAAGSQHLTHCRTPGDQQEASNDDGSEHELLAAANSHKYSDLDTDLQIDYHHGDYSWTQADPQTQQQCDFTELERQERIAGLRAKWRQEKADLRAESNKRT